VARQPQPRQGETLAVFLLRMLELRDVSLNGLARRAADIDGSTDKTWQRTLRRWKSGSQESISTAHAVTVSRILDADFSAFVTPQATVRDLLTQALDHLEALDRRVTALERP
jgi:hypothetical protein